MTRKFTFLLMALLALTGFKSWGQESQNIQIGTNIGTNTEQDMPFNTNWKFSYVQMLYLGDEIGESGTINSISFYATNSVYLSMNLDIYMKCVDRGSYSGTSDWETVTDEDLVFHSESYNANPSGWLTFTLDEPFPYDNTKNLMIAFDNNTGSYNSSKNFCYTSTSGNTCIYQRNDYTNVDPLDPLTANGAVGWRPNIILNMDVIPVTKYAINLTLPDEAVGTISSNPATEAAEGATVTLSANLNHGYEFDSWTVTNATTTESITVTNNQFTMPGSAVNVMANITELSPRSVNITNPTDDGNTTATLSATPSTGVFEGDEVRLSYSGLAEGYKFVNYVATTTTSEPIDIQQKWDGTLWQYYYCFTMPDANVNLTANVKLIRTITVAEMQHGSLSISPNSQYQQITAGETITINPNPNYGYQLGTLTSTEAISGNEITPQQQDVLIMELFTLSKCLKTMSTSLPHSLPQACSTLSHCRKRPK